ncbi:hypothetical protein OQA88_6911 [Cercophora sp. LCS_1]
MRRPRRFRKNTNRSWSEEETMGDVPQSPTGSLRRRDTGFPESFSGERTTSLPHPDAKLGADASLTEDDIAIDKAFIRHRMSLLVDRGHSHALNTNAVLFDTEQSYCASPSSPNDTERFPTIGRLAIHSLRGAELPRTTEPHSPKEGRNSLSLSSGESSCRDSPTSLKDEESVTQRVRELGRTMHKRPRRRELSAPPAPPQPPVDARKRRDMLTVRSI